VVFVVKVLVFRVVNLSERFELRGGLVELRTLCQPTSSKER
jgi:hypothetical protein